MQRKVLEYNVIFQKEKEEGFSVWVPDLPGCASQGETFEEALEMIKEAIELYLDDSKKKEEEREYANDARSQFMFPVRVAI